MELKRYLMILLRWWWLALVAMITVVTATIVFTYTQTPEYESEVRLIVSPAAFYATNANDMLDSLNTLSKPIVVNTYAEIAQSASIVQAAWDQLDISSARLEDFKINASVLQNTNILIISVTGSDPAMAQQVASAVSQQTLEYVSGLYEVYDLKLFDPASLPGRPTSPNEKLNLALGIVVGLGLGIICAFLAEYLTTPLDQKEQISIIDAQTGAYKRSYFLRRLQGEMSRARRVQRPFVVGIMRLDDINEIEGDSLPPATRQIVMKQVVQSVKQTLSEENLVARWRENELVLLLPDCDFETAQRTVEQLRSKLTWTVFGVDDTGLKFNFIPDFGLTEYDLNGIGSTGLLEQAEKALQETAAQNGHAESEINLKRENGSSIRMES